MSDQTTETKRMNMNPITAKRLAKMREDYVKHLKAAREQLATESKAAPFLDCEIETMEESINYIEGLHTAIKERRI